MSVMVYDHPLSPYGQKVKIALLEKGVPFTAQLPTDLGSGVTPEAFVRVSPRGEVPALVDGEVAVFDSSIILQYIEERWPEPPLLPASAEGRARARMIEDVMDTHFEAITWGLSEVRYFQRAQGSVAQQLEAQAAIQLRGWYAWLEQQLGSASWFSGSHFGWADVCVVPFVNGAVGFDRGPESATPLARWLERINERASVRECALAAQAASLDSSEINLETVRQAMEKGLFKREYRDHRLEWMIKSGGNAVVTEGLSANNIRFTDPFGESLMHPSGHARATGPANG